MSSPLAKARAELERARSMESKTAQDHQAAVRNVRDAENRVRRLEFAVIEADLIVHELQRRQAQGRG